MNDRVTWDSPGGVLIPMPLCRCGHPEGTHRLNPKQQRTACTVGPINDALDCCPCRRYEPGPA